MKEVCPLWDSETAEELHSIAQSMTHIVAIPNFSMVFDLLNHQSVKAVRICCISPQSR
jgi:hypothetical protein